MPKKIDLTGRKFGRLTAIAQDGLFNGKPAWVCECECGTVKRYRGGDLRLSKVLSCGCLRNDRVRSAVRTHGDSPRSGKRPEYNVWIAMRSRCVNPKNKDFKHYGGRGISVCERWMVSYRDFISDMGGRPSDKHTIDRIDVNGNYEPMNCRWATWTVQRLNQRGMKNGND